MPVAVEASSVLFSASLEVWKQALIYQNFNAPVNLYTEYNIFWSAYVGENRSSPGNRLSQTQQVLFYLSRRRTPDASSGQPMLPIGFLHVFAEYYK